MKLSCLTLLLSLFFRLATADHFDDTSSDIILHTENGRFKYRASGVICHNDKVLLITKDDFDYWYLPGGKVKLNETGHEAIQREIFEELGKNAKVERLLWTSENFYSEKKYDRFSHDLVFIYLLEMSEKDLNELHFEGHTLKWFDLDKLSQVKVYPKFLANELSNLPTTTKHIISYVH